MNGGRRLGGALVVALLLGSCGQAEEEGGEHGGLCPASVTYDGARFGADSRYGTPVEEGPPVTGVMTVACGDSDGEAVDAVAIVGVPVDVAFYAPDAYGAEFIMIRVDRSLTDEQLAHLTGS